MLNISVETVYFFQDSLMNKKFKWTAFFQIELFYNINVITVTFDQYNASLLKKKYEISNKSFR